MKKIFLTIILGLVLSVGLKAQTTMTVPAFSGNTVVMKMLEVTYGALQPVLTVTDGTIESTIDIQRTSSKSISVNAKLLVNTIKSIEEQGYKLFQIASAGDESGNTFIYLFKKD